MDRGAQQVTVHGLAKGPDTTEQLKSSNKYTALLQSSLLDKHSSERSDG